MVGQVKYSLESVSYRKVLKLLQDVDNLEAS